MAEVKVYRAAYKLGSDDDTPRIHFSHYITVDVQEVMEAEIKSHLMVVAGDPGGWIEPTIVGWEELVLDDDPF